MLAIGGAEDQGNRRTVLREFVRLAGGEQAKIAVVPTASLLGPEILRCTMRCSGGSASARSSWAWPESREDAEDPGFVGLLEDVTGIFMIGGNPAEALRCRQRHRRKVAPSQGWDGLDRRPW